MYRGKAVWEVVLTARDKKQELERITLFVTKDTYEPLCILLQRRGQQTRINDRRNRLHPVDQFVLNGVIKAQRATQKRDKDGQPR